MSVALDTAGVAARAHPEHPLRIALVTESYYPHVGGVCEHVHFLAREVRRRGHHVDIVTSNLPGAAPAKSARFSLTEQRRSCPPRRL